MPSATIAMAVQIRISNILVFALAHRRVQNPRYRFRYVPSKSLPGEMPGPPVRGLPHAEGPFGMLQEILDAGRHLDTASRVRDKALSPVVDQIGSSRAGRADDRQPASHRLQQDVAKPFR